MDIALLILAFSIFVVLGVGHGALMLFTSAFEPKDLGLLESLKNSKAGLTDTGNLWGGIKGFHLSHSLGMIIYGGLYITIALENSAYLKSSTVLNIGMFLVPIIYVLLAHKYWFSVPRNCFIVAISLLLASIGFR